MQVLLSADDSARVESRLRRVGDDMKRSVRDGDLLAAVEASLIGGKRIRPALVLAAYDAVGTPGHRPQALVDVACAFEVMHAAFIVHDDVIDEDDVRRGVATARAQLATIARRAGAEPAEATRVGDAGAIIVGDLLLAESSRLMGWCDAPHLVRTRLGQLFDDAVRTSADGEWADVFNSIGSPTRERILQATRDKTAAYTIAAPLAAGAVLAGADESLVASLYEIGSHIGTAYQLCDDLIGTFGTSAQAGREPETDLREHRATALVAAARESASWGTVDSALAAADTGPVAVALARHALARSGARHAVEQLVHDELDRARVLAIGQPTHLLALVDNLSRLVARRIP